MLEEHGTERGANSATLNDNDMATELRHRLIAERQRETGVSGRKGGGMNRARRRMLAEGVK